VQLYQNDFLAFYNKILKTFYNRFKTEKNRFQQKNIFSHSH